MYSRIAGTGSYLPEKVVSNFDLEKMMDTTDEWIRTRTGIERRHTAAEGQTTVDLGEIAARRAIEAAGVTPAASMARRAAISPKSTVVWPSAAMWRRSMPVRVRIHSSVVSIVFSRSKFETTFSGR